MNDERNIEEIVRRLSAIPGRYAMPEPDQLSKLPKPTNRQNEKGRCDECGGWHGLPAVHLDYMGHADVTLALLDVDPLWTWEPVAFDPTTGGPIISDQNGRLVMWARLTVLGRTVLGVGTCESGKGDPEKELIGDFLRNAAMRFGIGTKLWSKADRADPAGSGVGGGYERQERPARQDAPRGRSNQWRPSGGQGAPAPFVLALMAAVDKTDSAILAASRTVAGSAGMRQPTAVDQIDETLTRLTASHLGLEPEQIERLFG